MTNQTTTGRVLKPHYRLLGMLLEHQELRAKMAQFTMKSHSSFVRHDLVIAEIKDRIAALDTEIRNCYRGALAHFSAQGEGEEALWVFLGEDLVDELVVLEERQLA